MKIKKRLIFDIETSPNIGWFFKPTHWMRLNHDNIIIPGRIVCICYKWEGQHIVHSLTWNNKHDEKAMVEEFIKEMNRADELVTHNGEKFDILWVRTRALINHVPAMPDYVSIDTCKIAKKNFNFNSNKLSYIAKELGLGDKLDTGGHRLWKQVLMGETEQENPNFWNRLILGNNPSALLHMVEYCKQDVNLLEKVWHTMNPYVNPKSHFGWGTNTCPECGSTKLVVNKYRITAAGSKRITVQCKDCGKYQTIPESRLDNPKQF